MNSNAAKRFAFSLLIGAAVSLSAVAQQTGTLNGTLLDPQGAAVPNSVIELRWNYVDNRMQWGKEKLQKQKQPSKKILEVSTDSTGKFSVVLREGNWDVFAYRDGFAPTCAMVLIEGGKSSSLELRLPRFAPMPVQ